MARRSSRRRGTPATTNGHVADRRARAAQFDEYVRLSAAGLKGLPQIKLRPDLKAIEDRRTWHPERENRPARSYYEHFHRLVYQARKIRSHVRTAMDPSRLLRRAAWNQVPHQVAFRNPQSVLVCVRRKMRREVLHALRKTGSGSGRKKPKRNWTSGISCTKFKRRR